MNEEKILAEYKKYDYLNSDTGSPLVKILVGYIKPRFLFKSKILTPIQLGRAVEKNLSKEGKLSAADLKWLHENCIGDDNFEGNISSANRRVGFLTGTYWAWKNYEKLGNPEYFGFFGYRRLLSPKCLKNLSDFDFVIQTLVDYKNRKIKENIKQYGSNLYDVMLDTVKKVHPGDYKGIKSYIERKTGYYDEMYIMKKCIFFSFCEWIFPMLFYMLELDKNEFDFKNDDLSMDHLLKLAKKETRDIAYIVEHLTGYYLYKLTKNKDLKFNKVKRVFLGESEEKFTVNDRKNFIGALRERVKIAQMYRI